MGASWIATIDKRSAEHMWSLVRDRSRHKHISRCEFHEFNAGGLKSRRTRFENRELGVKIPVSISAPLSRSQSRSTSRVAPGLDSRLTILSSPKGDGASSFGGTFGGIVLREETI